MKRNCIVRLSFIMACFFAGCGLGDPERVDGDPCGGEGIEFLGTLGNGLSEISPPSAAQLGWYSKWKRCPNDYPRCVFLQTAQSVDNSKVLCSFCGQGELLCDSDLGGKVCVDVLSSDRHCGACGMACEGQCANGICLNPNQNDSCGATPENPNGERCGADRECVKGRCQCKAGLDECGEACVDLNSSETCGTSCDSVVRCNVAEGQACRNGRCECPDGRTKCGDTCVDLNSPETCGTSCDVIAACDVSDGQSCKDGRCVCPDGRTKCGEVCVDLNSSETCGTSCDNIAVCDASDGQSCKDGRCICPDGRTKCGDTCVDLNSPETCGKTCDNIAVCDASDGQSCKDGRCVCPDGWTKCGDTCVDLNSPETCGKTCDKIVACRTDESQKCNSGECVCPGGLLMREGHCIDPNRNNKYCGADDAGNPSGEKCNLKMNNVCRGGACECPPGQLKNKANECIDPKSDARYCGAVADSGGYVIDGTYSCGADRDCVDGDCVCRAGYRINRNGQCVKNSDEQCGARGDATSADPLNKDYMGYACSSGMSCGVMELVTVRDGVSTVTPLNSCISDGYSSCALDLGFYQNGIYVCPDSNIFKRCEASGSVDCECIPGYESALCSNTVKDDCSYTTCPESFECRIIDDVAQCVCPDGFVKIKANSISVCKEQLSLLSDSDYCGTNAANIVACKSSEICENGKCVRCAVSQMLCLDKCMERNDLDPETGELASLADRHVVHCNAWELTCEKGFANCNDTVLDGCESDLTSAFSCGSCDNVCPSEVTCSDGKCCLNPGKEISRKVTDESLEQIYNVRCCDSTASKLCATVAMGGEALSVVVQCRAACKSHEHDITDGKL